MVFMSPDALALEQFREAKTRRDLIFWNQVVTVLRLIDDELANLGVWLVSCATLLNQEV